MVIAPDFELETRAVAAYLRAARQEGTVPAQPAGGGNVAEHQGRLYVVLSNANGTLAVYRVRNDGVLKRLKRWPEEVAPA